MIRLAKKNKMQPYMMFTRGHLKCKCTYSKMVGKGILEKS